MEGLHSYSLIIVNTNISKTIVSIQIFYNINELLNNVLLIFCYSE